MSLHDTMSKLPPPQGLYHPSQEHDACGLGFVVNVKGQRSHGIVQKGLQILLNLQHRGACGCDGGCAAPARRAAWCRTSRQNSAGRCAASRRP